VLLLATAAFVANDLRSFRNSLVVSLSSTAQLVGESTISSLVFVDAESATEVLATLRLEPHIANACTYDAAGDIFATYSRSFESFPCPPAQPAGSLFGDDYLTHFAEISSREEQIGTIYLRADLREFRERVYQYVKVAVAVLAAGLLLSLSLALMLQRAISGPILHLVAATRSVSQTGDYERRVPREGEDELGELCDGFNEMLGEIQQRDQSLRDALEARVAERTGELAAANTSLHEVNAELVDARDKALEASRVKSQFLANMSHELRTPLNAIIGYSEILQEEAEDEGLESFVADLQRVHGAGRHLLLLISDILDLSKIEAGRMDLYLEDFSI
jgi:signal transduction histidine kinase